MSKKDKLITDFRFPYSKLKQLGDSTLLLIDRDIEEFTERGFTVSKRTAFKTTIDDFAAFATDEQLSAIQTDATATKDNERKKLEKQMRTFFLIAKIVFGESSGAYREFGNADISHQTDAELVRNARMTVAAATKYLDNLTTEGITEEKVTALEETASHFDDLIDLKTQAVHNRDLSTEQRITLANKVYALIVKYSTIGKDIWAEESPAKYNDYVLYNTPTGTVEPAPEETHPVI
jgi:hypothetical protein